MIGDRKRGYVTEFVEGKFHFITPLSAERVARSKTKVFALRWSGKDWVSQYTVASLVDHNPKAAIKAGATHCRTQYQDTPKRVTNLPLAPQRLRATGWEEGALFPTFIVVRLSCDHDDLMSRANSLDESLTHLLFCAALDQTGRITAEHFKASVAASRSSSSKSAASSPSVGDQRRPKEQSSAAAANQQPGKPKAAQTAQEESKEGEELVDPPSPWAHLAHRKTGLRVGSYILVRSKPQLITAIQADGVSDSFSRACALVAVGGGWCGRFLILSSSCCCVRVCTAVPPRSHCSP